MSRRSRRPWSFRRRTVRSLETVHRTVAELEQRVARTLRGKPAAFVFGKKDFALGSDATVARWRLEFPTASVVEIPDAGHFIQEDDPAACVTAIREMLATPG